MDTITRQTRDQLTMINSILDISQLDAKTMRVEKYIVSLVSLLEEIKADCDGCQNENLSITWQYALDLPAIKTDGEKLKNIIKNLINNAIKFTDKGRVTVSVEVFKSARLMKLEITDTGIGIPQNYLTNIFERFWQSDSSDTRSYGGLGVGLYIVKSFTEMLGGTIKVMSETGVGSTFIVQLPLYNEDLTATSSRISPVN